MAKCRVILLLPRLTLLVWLLCLQLQSSEVLVTAAAAEAAPQCRLYLAESSVEGAGLGVFSAVAAEAGEQLGHPDLLIPVVDSAHGDYEQWLALAYLWLATCDFHPMQWEAEQVDVLLMGLGAAVNGHMALFNVQYKQHALHTDSAGLHRSKDPGAGAFSYYHDQPHIATKPIEAGAEVFGNYGDQWFRSREHRFGSSLPDQSDYASADQLVQSMVDLLWHENQQSKGNETNPGTPQEMEALRQDVLELIRMVGQERVAAALPESHHKITHAAQVGTAKSSIDTIRSSEWLQEHGFCIDHLEAAPSSIPQAGRGAFATHSLKAGTTVAPAPLFHIHRDDLFILNEVDEIQETQLLLNYCFGHYNSSLLLCPYGSLTGFINHNHAAPNVKVVWSQHPTHKSEMLNMTLGEFLSVDGKEEYYSQSGLLMEYVALRDIQQGEEILFNYGDEWEDAWNQHVATWTPMPGAETYVSASNMNADPYYTKLQTLEEMGNETYPENIFLTCKYSYLDEGVSFSQENATPIVREFNEEGEFHEVRPCEVISRDDSQQLYTVQLFNHWSTDPNEVIFLYDDVIVTNFPRRAITFADDLYTTDQFLPNAFRHPIMVPDDLFPRAWMDHLDDADDTEDELDEL